MPPTEGFDKIVEFAIQALMDLLKAGRYILGVVVGVAAKLAIMHRTKNITWKDVTINSAIALATAYGMYHFLIYIGRPEVATPISVICGRYSDDILNLAFRWFKRAAKMTADDIDKS
jgi:hypothetical protein